MNVRVVALGLGLLTLPWLGGCFDQGSGGGGSNADGGVTFPGDASFLEAAADSAPAGSVTVGAGPVIDFGLAECGGKAPAPSTFTVHNGASASVHYSLSLSATSVFQITGPTSGDVAAGADANVTLAASAVPASATAAQVDKATLTITTDEPSLPTAQITLQRTAEGATLTLSPATAAFGDVPVSATSQPMALSLTNTGNEAATVAIGAPSAAAFSVSGGGTTGTPVAIAPKASAPMLSATFTPTVAGSASAASTISVTGAVCGGSVSSIPMTGNGVIGVVAVTPGTLDFQAVDCGQTAPPQTVKVANSGGAPFTFKAVLLGGASSPYAVSPTTGTVAPGATTTVTITPGAIPKVASTAANAFGDTLQITTNLAGDENHDVTLTETAQGAVLGLSATTIALGNVVLQQTLSSPFTITNTGTLPATVSLQVSGTGFGATPTTATTLTPGGSPLSGSATFTPASLGSQSGSIAITTGATDVLCSPPLVPIALSGTGTNGTLSVSTNALNFASVPCGTTAAPQTFTISNPGTAPFTWSATLGLGGASPYKLSPSSGTQAPGAAATIVTVTPAAIPFPSALTANLYGDTITITPAGITGGAAQKITLTETAEGAVISAAPSPLPPFAGQQEHQASAPATLTLTNTGTMSATVTPTISGANASSFSLATPGATALAANGGHYSPGPTFTPQTTGALAAQVDLAVGPTDVLCQPLPAAVTMSGTGTNGSITLGASSLSIAAQPCGAGAGLTQPLKLTNNGTAALTWNAAVLGTSGFSVSPATGTLAAGGASVTLTVTGPVFSTTHGSVATVTDTLQVTTTAYGDVPHDVALSSTPSGAILAWGAGLTGLPFGTVQATPGGTKGKNLPLSVDNTGNTAATVTFALSGTTTFTFSPQGTPVAGGSVLNGNATFDPTTSSGQSDTVNVTVPNGTTLCAALPAGLPISGTGAQGTYSVGTTGLAYTLTCNAQAPGQTFTINDTPGVVPYDFTASVTAGWTVAPASGTVSPGTPFTLTVTPPAQGTGKPGGSTSATVAITTDIPGDVVHDVATSGTISGQTFAFMSAAGASQPSLSWGSTVQGTGTDTTYLVGGGNASPSTVPVVVTADVNNYPGATLLINGVDASTWTGTGGTNTVTYSLDYPASCPCGAIFNYTITVPATSAGVCGGTTQTLSILEGNNC